MQGGLASVCLINPLHGEPNRDGSDEPIVGSVTRDGSLTYLNAQFSLLLFCTGFVLVLSGVGVWSLSASFRANMNKNDLK